MLKAQASIDYSEEGKRKKKKQNIIPHILNLGQGPSQPKSESMHVQLNLHPSYPFQLCNIILADIVPTSPISCAFLLVHHCFLPSPTICLPVHFLLKQS